MKNKEIAARLRQLANAYPSQWAGQRAGPQTVFTDGSFKLKCLPYGDSIRALAAKFEKGYNRRTFKAPNKPKPGPRFDKTTFKQFVDDGEYDNAVNYARAAGKPVYFATLKAGGHTILVDVVKIPGQTQAIVARCEYAKGCYGFNVFHIGECTGCNLHGDTAKEALANFAKVSPDFVAKDFAKCTDETYLQISAEYGF